MSSPKVKSKDSSWSDILSEMNDKSQMEDLRQHLVHYGLFPRDVDPVTAPIKMEYLQKLARQWKLHHRRGFWKEHATLSTLVVGLHEHHTSMLSGSVKAKAARQAAKLEESKDVAFKDVVHVERELVRVPLTNSLPNYGIGDKFGTRGDYVEGTMYLSRFMGKAASVEDVKRVPGPLSADVDTRAPFSVAAALRGPESGKEDSDEDIDCVVDSSETAKNCALALCNFSLSSGFHSRIIAAGAVTSLVDTWNTCEEAMKDDVAAALCQLASDSSRVSIIEGGALPAILSLAVSRNPAVQQLCAATLSLLSSAEENILFLLMEGSLLALEPLAAAVDPATRLLSAIVLRNLASLKSHRALMIKEDTIKTLIPLSLDSLADTRRNAAVAISRLCNHKRSQHKLILENVAEHLTRLAGSADSDAETRSCSSQALCALCNNKATRLRLVKEGVVPIIVAQARSDVESLQQKAATAILYLSLEEGQVRLELLDNDAIPILLSLAVSGTEKTRRHCAMALCNILCQVETQHKILELNALSAFNALATCNDEDIQEKAASTLLRLAKDEVTGRSIVGNGGLIPILALATAKSADIRLQCLSAMQHFSSDPINHRTMVQSGVVEAIIGMIALPDERFKLGGAQVLTNLACSLDMQDDLKVRGVLPALLRLSSFDVTNSFAATGLCNFAANKAMRRFLIESGAVPILIGLAKSTSELTKQDCCRAICNLSALEGSEQAITNSGGAAGLIMVALFRSDTAETKGICASALLNLMTLAPCREQLIKEDVVWVLIKLAASEDSNDNTRSVCARAMCSLSFNAKGCTKLLEHKAIPALFTLCRDGDEKTKRYAAITLSNLTGNKDAHAMMMQQDAVACLVQLADTEDAETRLNCVGALCNLSTSVGCRPAMIEGRASAALNVANCQNKESMRRSAIALVNLSDVTALQSEFVQQGALSGLLELCTSGSTQIKVMCARALYNLSFGISAREELVKSNALPALVCLLQSKVEYTMGLCAVACFNISQLPLCQAQLCESGTLAAIASILESTTSVDTRRACYLTVCNIAASKLLSTHVLDSGAISVLINLTSASCSSAAGASASMELIQVCVRVLRNVSFTAPLRTLLVEQGVCKTFIAFHKSQLEEVREDCVVGMCNLARDEPSLSTLVSEGIVPALGADSLTMSGDIQRLIAGAFVCLTRPPELREVVAADGMLTSLAKLLHSDLDDVKTMCSTSVRNLSANPTVQSKMVETGMLSLLITIMAVKDDGRAARAPQAGGSGHTKISLLPSPVQGWTPGRSSDASAELNNVCDAQIVYPAYTEQSRQPAAKGPEEGKEEDEEEVPTGDLGNAGGFVSAQQLSTVALGEPLWTKLEVGEMSLSFPTRPVSLLQSAAQPEKSVKPLSEVEGEGGGKAAGAGASAHESEEDDELYFDFKLSSPSSEFYKKQASRGAKSTVSFEQVNRTSAARQAPVAESGRATVTPTKLPKLGVKTPSPRTLTTQSAAAKGGAGGASSKLPRV